jgi:hypothetical protein
MVRRPSARIAGGGREPATADRKEGLTMSQRTRKRRAQLTVRVSFEPNRLADACLADAYERATPIGRREPPRPMAATPAPARRAAGGERP